MKARKVGNKYIITYRCPGYPIVVNESFDTQEAADLRITQIAIEKKEVTLRPPIKDDALGCKGLHRETITVDQPLDEYIELYGLKHWSEGTLSCNLHRINDYIRPFIGGELLSEGNAWLYVEKELLCVKKDSLEKLREQERDEVIFTFPAWKKMPSTTSLVLKTPKTESSVRQIYLPNTIAEALIQHKAHQNEEKVDLASEYQDYNLVVAQKVSNGDIKSVQGNTGHAVSNMVKDVYSHIFDASRRHMAKQVDEQFFAASEDKNNCTP